MGARASGIWAGLTRVLRVAFRALCYLALAALVGAVAAMSYLTISGLCDTIHTGMVSCVSDGARAAANAAMSVMLIGAFTGVPVLLAFCGFILLVRDGWRLFRRVRPSPDRAG
jgi:hypothetical protein